MTTGTNKTLEHVKLVDSKFAEFKIAPIAFGLQYGRIIVAISGLGYVAAGGYWSLIAYQAAIAGATNESINLTGVSSGITAIGIASIALIASHDLDRKIIGLKENFYYGKLDKLGIDSLTLRALIKMRVLLPKKMTLEKVYVTNRNLFTPEELARRLVTP